MNSYHKKNLVTRFYEVKILCEYILKMYFSVRNNITNLISVVLIRIEILIKISMNIGIVLIRSGICP